MRRARLLIPILALLAAGCGPSTEGKFGRELYEISCAGCHGASGEGDIGPAVGTSDSNAALALSDDQIAGSIEVGPGKMPGFGQLTAEQVDSLVEYLRSLQGR